MTNSSTDLDEKRRQLWARDTASHGLGIELVKAVPGACVAKMAVTEKMMNLHGTCHGGIIFAFAGTALAYAMNMHDEPSVAQNCHITYLMPAQAGDELTAEAREISRRGKTGMYDVRVTNQRGEHVAEFRGHSFLVKPKKA